ncbi:MAG TPA: hypothetical protein VH500_12785 [Nitrososphaeraceae archaeon]|jgi:hypothetical protein
MSLFDKPISVTEIIREILSSNALYYWAVQSGIANYSALAKKMKPEIEKRTECSVNIGTIVVGLQRIANALIEQERERNSLDHPYFNRMANNNLNTLTGNTKSSVKISLIGNIVDVDVKDAIEYDQISNVLTDIFGRETKYSLFQTDKRLRIFVEDEEISNPQGIRSAKYVKRIEKGLSKITITIPSNDGFSTTDHKESDYKRNVYGIYLSIVHILYNHQLPIHNAFLTPNKIVLILSDKDAAKTYEILRTRISSQ